MSNRRQPDSEGNRGKGNLAFSVSGVTERSETVERSIAWSFDCRLTLVHTVTHFEYSVCD